MDTSRQIVTWTAFAILAMFYFGSSKSRGWIWWSSALSAESSVIFHTFSPFPFLLLSWKGSKHSWSEINLYTCQDHFSRGNVHFHKHPHNISPPRIINLWRARKLYFEPAQSSFIFLFPAQQTRNWKNNWTKCIPCIASNNTNVEGLVTKHWHLIIYELEASTPNLNIKRLS